MAIWTPPSASKSYTSPKALAEYESEMRVWERQVLSMMHTEGGILDYWNVELAKIDKNLRLMQAGPLASAAGVKAGYYHLVRLRDPAEATFMMVQPLHDMQGNFVEPTSQMLDILRAADLQSERVIRDRMAHDERVAASKARALENEHEAAVDHGVEVYKSQTRTQVLMSPDVPYSQNNSATSRRARGEASKAK